ERSLSERISQIDTAYKQADRTAAANLSTLERTLTQADSALSERIGRLDTDYRSNKSSTSSRLATAEQSLSDAHQALSKIQTELASNQSDWGDDIVISGKVAVNNTTAYNIANYSLSQTVQNETIKITVRASTNLTTIYVLDADSNVQLTTLNNPADGVFTGELQVNAALNRLKLNRLPYYQRASIFEVSVQKQNKSVQAQLQELKQTVTSADSALSERISQLDTTLNGQTTSIRDVQRSVNGVRAIKAVTVDNNGFISGYGLMSELANGRVTSRFGINADQIYFGATTSAKKPFVFTTRTTTIDGVSYPAGAWLNSASIARASINMLHIADSIQSDNYVAGRQGWRLFKDGRFELNNTFGDGSSLELNSKGLIVWYNKARGKKAVELGIFR
ncbi:hypothetical protein, partial [Moraxella sp. E6BC]|uniref:phage tail tip fiber protein n=2 Tax=unclassified Moraxella TaxID=2685852 RepID=UPI00359E8EE6